MEAKVTKFGHLLTLGRYQMEVHVQFDIHFMLETLFQRFGAVFT